LRAEVRDFSGEGPRVIEPQRPGRTGESHFARIGRLDLEHRVGGDDSRRVALLLDDARVEDEQMTHPVIAGQEVGRREVTDHGDLRHGLAAAVDGQHAGGRGARRIRRIDNARSGGIDVEECD
jgi:hypothetical protein